MKLSNKELKELMEQSIENPLVDNLFNYYYEGKFVPSLITENKIVFYSAGRNKFYISSYDWGNDGIVCEGLRRLTFGSNEKKDEKISAITKGIFQLDENKESFSKSLKKMKKIISENEVILNEDVFIDRMKSLALSKSKIYLGKQGTQVPSNQNSDTAREFKNRMSEISNKIKQGLKASLSNALGGQGVDKFYDYLDMKKVNFSYSDGNGLYKKLKIFFPKSIMWINENESLLKKQSPQWSKGMQSYGNVIDDVCTMLKRKKYIDDEEKNPAKHRTSELLGILGRGKSNTKEFWKDAGFKSTIKETYEEDIEVEDLLHKYPTLNVLSESDLVKLMEKTLVSVFDDGKKLNEAKAVGSALYKAMSKLGTREDYLSGILGVQVNHSDSLIKENEIGNFITAQRNPDDLPIVAVRNLAETIENYIGRYRESDMPVEDLKTLESSLFKLNDIWARQRITESDRKFLKSVVEGLQDIEKKDDKASEDIVKNKDMRREGINNVEAELTKNSAISESLNESWIGSEFLPALLGAKDAGVDVNDKRETIEYFEKEGSQKVCRFLKKISSEKEYKRYLEYMKDME